MAYLEDSMFEHVLVPVTDSASNLDALDQAIDLAARHHLTLMGVNVLLPGLVDAPGIGPAGYMGTGYVSPAEYELDAQALQYKERAQQEMLADFQSRCRARGVACVPIRDAGSPADDLLRCAEDADLIWLSREGLHEGHTTWFSTFEPVVRRSPVPVWLTHAGAQAPRRLTVAFDGHPQAVDALRVAARLSRQWDLPLDLLVVHDGQQKGMDEGTLHDAGAMMEAFDRSPDTASLVAGHPATVLAGATGPDTLLVMGTHSHGTFLGFRRGHTVDDVLQGARGPVVLCPADVRGQRDGHHEH